jgi:anti-sigma28 factor (negative regulator of flagellin synthesis)
MKIHESNATNPSGAANVSAVHHRTAAPVTTGSTEQAGGSTESSDHVQVSTLGHRLDAHSASHAARIIELSSVVSAGRYQVDAQVLSHKIIQEHIRTAA